jgi:hypothetical protein
MGKALESVYAESLPEEECGVVERLKERRGGTAMAEIPDKSHNAEFYSSNWVWKKKRKRERKTQERLTRERAIRDSKWVRNTDCSISDFASPE